LLRKLDASKTAAIASLYGLAPSSGQSALTEGAHPIYFSFCYWDTIATEVIMHYEPVAVESTGVEAVQVARARGGTRPVKRILAALGLAFVLGLLAPACGGGSESSLPTPGPAGEAVIRVEMRNNFFFPNALTVRAGRDYILELRNRDGEAHNLRITGIDNEYGTDDDLVSDDVDPGKTGSLAFRIDQPGVYDFRSDSQLISMVGTLTVWEAPPIATWVPVTPSPTEEAESPTPSPTGEAESPTPSPTAEAESPPPSPTAEIESPTPSPTTEAESPTPSPTGEAESPTPSPTTEAESPTPSPTGEAESPTPSPTTEAESPTPTATPTGE
jgi:plastocyanin